MIDDLRFAWRRLRHAPGFAAVAIVTLALAIGSNAAIFSVADAVLFRPLPYSDPDSVSILRWANRKTGARYTLVQYEFVQAIDERDAGLGPIGMIDPAPSVIVPGPDGAESVPVAAASANYFQILGVRPARGRLFDEQDAQSAGRIAVLPYAAWRQRFGGDEGIVGRSVTLGPATFDIVGVLPADFVFPTQHLGRPQIVTVMKPVEPGTPGGAFHPIVRLDPGVTRSQAQSRLDALLAPLLAARSNADTTLVLDDVRSVLYPVGRPIMTLLVVAAGLVLLIGCANLANMLLARSHRAARETGVRTALGASRMRLIRPVIFEALLIGIAGAGVALAATSLTFDALLRQVPPVAYRGAPVGVDLRVVLFASGLGLAAGLIFAAVPAWRSASLDAQALLQGRGRIRGGRFGRPMVAVQVALAIALVFGAVVAGRAFLSVLRIPLGFEPENLVTVIVRPRGVSGLALQQIHTRAIEGLVQRSHVIAAGAGGSMPFGSAADEAVLVGGVPDRRAGIVHVLPGYFETLRIPLLRGRLPSWDDMRSGASVAVLSDGAGRTLFADRDPLGATVFAGKGRPLTVIGVVADVRASLDSETTQPVYAIPGDVTRMLTLVVRTRTRDEASLASIKRDVAALAPSTPITADWWADIISGVTAYRNPRFQTLVLGGFAALALMLTGVGIFGVVAFLVATRTREMGIRLALGAKSESLVGLMVRQALTPVAVGLAGGLIATRWAARLAEAQLFKVETRDPLTLGAAALVVVAAALLAAYLPARRASRVDPAVVLRVE